MKPKILTTAVLALLFLCSCQAQVKPNKKTQTKDQASNKKGKSDDIPYTIAQRYFVKNTVKPNSLKNPKIETAEMFDEFFGAATVMGEGGRPTQIDFSKQFVIAVISGDTNYSTEIIPVSLKKGKDQIVFNYQIKVGEKLSFTIGPVLIIIVDKSNKGKVTTKQQKN